MKKGRGGHTLVSFFASSSQIWREDCSLKSSPSSLFRLWSAIVYFSLYFLFALDLWLVAVAQSGCGLQSYMSLLSVSRDTCLSRRPFHLLWSYPCLHLFLPEKAYDPSDHGCSLSDPLSSICRFLSESERKKQSQLYFLLWFIHLIQKESSRYKSEVLPYSFVKYVKKTSLWSGSGHSYLLFSVVSTWKYS